MELIKNPFHRLLFTYGIFAIAMAYLESTIVVYLRLIYYPDGFGFPLKIIPAEVAVIEIGREAVTLVMLWFITRMSAREFKKQFALFIYSFGVWDIFYYIWLKIFLNWPAGWTEWDILFLIPLPWIAPWLVPALVSVGFIVAAIIILKVPQRFPDSILSKGEWWLQIAAAGVILWSFFWETADVLAGQVPDYYPWWLFGVGLISGLAVFFRRMRAAGI